MSTRTTALACALLCVSAVGCTAAAPVTNKAQMHRAAAGTLGADGWTDAVSTNGRFSVRLPCLFNDFTVNDSGADVVKGDALGCRASSITFAATRLQYRSEDVVDTYFQGMSDPGKWPGAKIERGTYRGLPSVTVFVDEAGKRCGVIHTVLAKPDIILMSVDALPPECTIAKTMGAQFLDSLRVDSTGP